MGVSPVNRHSVRLSCVSCVSLPVCRAVRPSAARPCVARVSSARCPCVGVSYALTCVPCVSTDRSSCDPRSVTRVILLSRMPYPYPYPSYAGYSYVTKHKSFNYSTETCGCRKSETRHATHNTRTTDARRHHTARYGAVNQSPYVQVLTVFPCTHGKALRGPYSALPRRHNVTLLGEIRDTLHPSYGGNANV